MASCKKPVYKVETKLVPDRKRRKSDLVVMWYSVWDVTSIVLRELWTTLLKMWEFFEMWFSSSDRFQVQIWLEKYLPYVPDDFNDNWRDGRLMAILLDKLHPGCYPDAYKLDPDYGLKNVYKAFDVLEMYFGIKPNVSPEEILTCTEGSDVKLFEILMQLKCMSDTQEINVQHVSEPDVKEKEVIPYSVSQSCVVKGTGLAIGFIGKCCNFILFCAAISELDVVIEIKGPTTICSEKITNRSPKKKRAITPWEYPRCLIRSESYSVEDNTVPPEVNDLENRLISLEYEIVGNQVYFSYKPKEKGKHRLAVLWHGQHVSDSPYFVEIEDPLELKETGKVAPLKSAMKSSENLEKSESRKISVRFQESSAASCRDKHFGRIRSKRVLGYIVKISGKDVPVNARSTEALANELLKMDYDFESCSTYHRRNSWGFAGDAERKRSVIRQFGIDVKELEAQVNQRRTRSLSVYPGRKKLLEKSDSFESLPSMLNIVQENEFECSKKNHNFDSQEEAIEYFREHHSEKSGETDCECIRNVNTEKTEKCAEDSTGDCNVSDDRNVLVTRYSREEEGYYAFLSEDYENNKRDEDMTSLELEEGSKTLEFSNNLSLSTFNIDLTQSMDKLDSNNEGVNNVTTLELEDTKPLEYSNDLSLSTSNLNCGESGKDKLDSTEISTLSAGFSPEIKVDNLFEDFPTNILNDTENLKEINTENETYETRSCREKHIPNVEVECTKSKRQNIGFSNLSHKQRQHKMDRSEFKKCAPLFLNREYQKKLPGRVKTKEHNLNKFNNKHDFSRCDITITRNTNLKINPSHSDTNYEILNSNESRLLQRPELNDVVPESNQTIACSFDITHIQLTNNLMNSSDETGKVSVCGSEESITEQICGSNSCRNIKAETDIKTGQPLKQFTDTCSINTDNTVLSNFAKDRKDDCSKPFKSHSLRTLKQLNFKQFKASIELPSTSPVKSQIKLWERSSSAESQSEHPKKNITETDEVNVREKLAFWESTSKSRIKTPKDAPRDIKYKNEVTVEISRRVDVDKTGSIEDTGRDVQEKNV